ncbi:MAG: hypothetical protein JST86_09390 [Bacteroidetes bacterium]|nr:hypothetical protein [Bacteroidota bacterium]
MNIQRLHSFHIPVLGLAYSIDTPVKVARFGISSVISIMDDQLIEDMRKFYCNETSTHYIEIRKNSTDHRARRITEYLNLVNTIVTRQVETLRNEPFDTGSEIVKYFELLPESSPVKKQYYSMQALPAGVEKLQMQIELRSNIAPGAIDVNIMSKVDKTNFDESGNELPAEYSDALAAFRGYAQSHLQSSVVLSAGYNPRLYAYAEQFPDFYPDEHGNLKKKIILKVSDFRSALVQGKIFAKKGLWISEFRIESGLNCGGHAFATEGLLLGPILGEFKDKKVELSAELFALCHAALSDKDKNLFGVEPAVKITVQGGIGTANEDEFLIKHYELDGTGWGSPFLLVPEATNVDEDTLNALAAAKQEDYYLSDASPLGIPFNNFRKSTSEKQRLERIEKGRPGSPCHKKFLASDTEFTDEPICTASRKYQHLKINQLKNMALPEEMFNIEYKRITDKDCLCEGLGTTVRLKDGIPLSHKLSAVTICPGPNLAYFSGVFSLKEMTDHIYGRINILNTLYRPNMFVNELHLYIDHFKKKIAVGIELSSKQVKSLNIFKTNLFEGINYYKRLASDLKKETDQYISVMKEELDNAANVLASLNIQHA